MFCALNREADAAQLLSDFILQLVALLKESAQFRCQPLHLIFKRLAVVFLLGYSYIATRRKDKVLRTDIVDGTHGTEALLVFEAFRLPRSLSAARQITSSNPIEVVFSFFFFAI